MLNQWRTPSTSIWYSKSRNGRHWPSLLPQPPLERRTLAAAHIADERQRLETGIARRQVERFAVFAKFGAVDFALSLEASAQAVQHVVV